MPNGPTPNQLGLLLKLLKSEEISDFHKEAALSRLTWMGSPKDVASKAISYLQDNKTRQFKEIKKQGDPATGDPGKKN